MDSKEFYNALSDNYHLIATGWDEAVRKQGSSIDSFLKKQAKTGVLRILDCSCGIGTQSIGLALQGHSVLGTDVSDKEIARAREETQRLGAKAEFRVADMRSLPSDLDTQYDVVLSYDNALAHLQEDSDLDAFLRSAFRSLSPGGILLLSMRDYDTLAEERPTGMVPRTIKDHLGERVYVQTWDWTPDGRSYDMRLFILRNRGTQWEGSPIQTRMRVYRKAEVLEATSTAGFLDGRWLTPQETGYYQPVLQAQKP